MFASQTKDYTSYTAKNMWLITPYSSSSIWSVYDGGYLNTEGLTFNILPCGVRPSINLKSTIVVKSGSGTETDPFVVGLPS